jgi:hypothetical protein
MKHAATVNLATHPKPYVHVKPLARSQDCDPRRILRMIRAGALKAYRVGREWRIPIDEACRAFHVERQLGSANNHQQP